MYSILISEESITIPNGKLINAPNSFVTLTPQLDHFPDPASVTVYYTLGNQQKLGPFHASSQHVVLIGKDEERKSFIPATAYAKDPYGYEANCSFTVLKGEGLLFGKAYVNTNNII